MDEITKEFPVTPIASIDLSRCVVGVKISTPNPDRAKDIILPDAWQLENHQKIPIALFSHDVNVPIGLLENRTDKSYTVKQYEQALVGEIFFNQSDPRAMQIFDAVSQGVIRGCSPGFRPLTLERNPNGRYLIKSAELIEVSLCVIPENPEAIVEWIRKSKLGADDVLVKHLKPYCPLEKSTVSATVPETVPAAEADSRPAGAMALDEIHTMALAFKVKLASIAKKQESPAVKDYIETLSASIDEMVSECSDIYQKEYPDAEPLKESDTSEDAIPVSEVKQLKLYEREYKRMKEVINRQSKEIDNLIKRKAVS